jgi:demethylmenaquinone methyltransferase/2-methoxy-6-polyprenyl-1,4-benzoquinol methylase
MNDLMSAGTHRLWKAELIRWLRPTPAMRLADIAGGTGDIARTFRASGGGPAIVVDVTPAMLGEGRRRALDAGVVDGIDWIAGDGESLPLADASVDAATIAFGLRNMTHIDRALGEARRVLMPGGRLMILEFAPRADVGFDGLYDLYSFHVVPEIARWVAGDAEPYRYLVESIRRFPRAERLSLMIAAAGFAGCRHRHLAAGIAQLHSAWRI